jgi:glycine cleavage system aminomethyltransferase T
MSFGSLEQKLKSTPSLRDWLRNAPIGFYQFPVPDEHTNWRNEQRAWSETAVMFDQSYHMLDVYIEGPDTKRLLSETSLNNYTQFGPMKAFQYVACSPEGYIIGDAVGFNEDGKVNIVGKPSAGNYLCYVAETGGYDVKVTRDARVVDGDGRRQTYRFQVQGPNAYKILEKATGAALPETRPFGMCQLKIAGRTVTALRHGMAGAPGLEFWGPYDEREDVRRAVIEAGRDFGMKLGGGKTYSTAGPQSGWVGALLPAIYTSPELRSYREWLSEDSYEGKLSLGGSFMSDRMEDFYFDPWDLGYHRLIHWDHEFQGRSALMAKRDGAHRKKVWLKWNPEDVTRVVGSMLGNGEKYKFLEWPAGHYATCPYDQVLDGDTPIGMSVYAAYTVHAQGWFSIGIIEEDKVEFGKEVSLIWGEPDGGTHKPTVEPHVQTRIRATMTKTALG